ncbi:MAG: hypothetical protein DME25_01320 [Verrucomicrobia bacterium]|nr:MAG: hypothetical protein DME25_01320 [Verrucomicrobiota bacterium]
MSNDKTKGPSVKPPSRPGGTAAPSLPLTKPATPGPPGPAKTTPIVARVPPLFRKTDWLTFLITAAAVWIGYFLTMAPELTLEDSGELATGSFYAGIPHPPGYPVWTMYTWLWTVLLPIKNIAWRVALGELTSGAVAAGLLALLVSRGSSLLIEGIEELKGLTGRWESAVSRGCSLALTGSCGANASSWRFMPLVFVRSW